MGLDIVELVMSVEEEFKIDVLDKDAEYLTTPRKLANYVMCRISLENITSIQDPPSSKQDDSDFQLILQRIIHITSEQMSIPIDQIHPDSDFIYDLHIC